MKIIPVVGKTYYGKWRHYDKVFQQRQLNGKVRNLNERREVFKVKRMLTITPCHSCPCHCAVFGDYGEFDHWGCSLGAEVVDMPTRLKHPADSDISPHGYVKGAVNCPLISIQHVGGVYLKPTATVQVYDIHCNNECRLVEVEP